MVMVPHTTHEKELVALRRIEGQVRGVQKMIDERKYCVDIIIQLHAVINALYRVAEKIFGRHLEHCVTEAFRGKSEKDKLDKIDEIMDVVKRFHEL